MLRWDFTISKIICEVIRIRNVKKSPPSNQWQLEVKTEATFLFKVWKFPWGQYYAFTPCCRSLSQLPVVHVDTASHDSVQWTSPGIFFLHINSRQLVIGRVATTDSRYIAGLPVPKYDLRNQKNALFLKYLETISFTVFYRAEVTSEQRKEDPIHHSVTVNSEVPESPSTVCMSCQRDVPWQTKNVSE
jgi:hypothetical protein